MPNRLAHEKSPYLRQHADQPVAWIPWGPAALARARAEDKPVFLSIGYSTCHWCHVMAHESFDDPGVAAALNRDFIPVKVDREERPDLDRLYMAFVQHTTGHGGWPMSVWLTPDGHPFFGGTYFPRDDRHGRPGFLTLLGVIARHWAEQRGRIVEGAAEVVAGLRRLAADGPAAPVAEGAPGRALEEEARQAVAAARQYFFEAFDPRWGGFGGAPKFPRASVLDLLFQAAADPGVGPDERREAAQMAALTLQRIAEGGIHDHVGGGFHRYAVDETWHVPHFEKMLYDQALIAGNCLAVRQATGREVYAWLARDIFDYVQRDLTGPSGEFYSAEDADSVADGGPSGKLAEGAFYIWTRDEVAAVLGSDAEFFCGHFDVQDGGNVAHDPHGEFHGRNVLRQARSVALSAQAAGLDTAAAEQRLVACLERLREARARRIRPARDGKVITAWNGLMISALARGAAILRDESLLARAKAAARFIRRELCDESTGGLYRTWLDGRGAQTGFAEDYAYLIQGLLDLYEASFDLGWLQWAESLQVRMDELFWDEQGGGYFNSAGDDPTVIVRLKEDYDGAEPAPGSVAALNLARLDGLAATPGAAARARAVWQSLAPQWRRAPQALPQLLASYPAVFAPRRTLVIAGDPQHPAFSALVSVWFDRPQRSGCLLHADGGAGQAWLAARHPYLASVGPVDGLPAAYLCDERGCQLPVTSPAALAAVLG